MGADVVVGAGHDADATGVGVVGEALQVGDERFRLRHVQLAVGVHEVHLRVHVPEEQIPLHTPSRLRDAKSRRGRRAGQRAAGRIGSLAEGIGRAGVGSLARDIGRQTSDVMGSESRKPLAVSQ